MTAPAYIMRAADPRDFAGFKQLRQIAGAGFTSLMLDDAALQKRLELSAASFASTATTVGSERYFIALEHVEDPVLVLKIAQNWLNAGGKLIAIVPHADSLHRRLAVAMGMLKQTDELGETDRKMGHRRVYNLANFENDIQSAGFDIEARIGLFVKLLPNSMMTGFSDDLLKGLMELGDQLPIEFATSIAFVCSRSGHLGFSAHSPRR